MKTLIKRENMDNYQVDYFKDLERRGIITNLQFVPVVAGYWNGYYTVVNEQEYNRIMFG